ncbi:MAG: cytochrome c [Terracidiphilus sp.]
MGRIILGIVLGLVLAPLLVLAWFRWGHPPVAVADPPLPMEHWITHVALNARINREKPDAPLVQVDETNLVAGAEIYRDQCAACHGFYGKPSSFGPHMFPKGPQLWQKHRTGNAVGVSNDPPGVIYWKVENGIRLTGMPAFKDVLSTDQMWQVTQLLANADKPLPPEALQIVRGEQPTTTPAPAPASQKAPQK